MSRIKDLTKIVSDLAKNQVRIGEAMKVIHKDLYASIKEVSQLKYSIVELDLRLSNLETMVKTLTTGEV